MAARLAPVNWGVSAAFGGLTIAVGLLAGVDPKFAIAASLAVGFLFLVLADLTAGLAAFALLIFLEILGAGSLVSVGKLGGVVLALGWLGFMATHSDAKSDFLAVHPGMSLVIGTFLGWILLSALWAENTPEVVGTFSRFLPNAILFLIVFAAVRNLSQASLVVAGFIAGAAASGAYGIFFAGAIGGRLAGGGADPNELASFGIASFALSFGLAAGLKGKPGLRLAVIGAGSFGLIVALLTGSRGGIVCLACMLVAGILIGGRWRGRIAIAAAMVAILAAFYITALAPPQIRERIVSSTEGQTRVVEGRTTLWQIGERMVRANPVQGVGAGNFQTSSRHYLLQPGSVYRSDVVVYEPQVAHNTYLGVAAELGFVGLALFGSILAFSLFSSVRAAQNFASRGDVRGDALCRSLTLAMVAIFVANFFLSQEVNKQLWLLLGIGPALLAVSRRADPDQPGSTATA